jgi:hypothetical protein
MRAERGGCRQLGGERRAEPLSLYRKRPRPDPVGFDPIERPMDGTERGFDPSERPMADIGPGA